MAVDMSNEGLKLKYRVPTGARGRSYISPGHTGPIKPKGEKIDGALAKIIRDERKAQRERQSHVKVTLVLTPDMKRRFEKEYV
jgi:hypothetical protein